MLKKEVKLLSTEDLNTRYCRILERGETLEAEDIPITDARQILWIEDILRERLIKAVGHDFFPPEYSTTACVKPSPLKAKNKFTFKITITSSIGSVVKTLSVKLDSKPEANTMAQETIDQLGLKGATYKIT